MADRAPRKRKLFVGVDLDPEARAACAGVSDELRKTGFAAKYETPDKLHVTLAFLGFVEPSRCEAIVAELAAAAAGSKPFEISLDKLGAFPHEGKPRVVYLGAREQRATFRLLAKGVRSAYAALGFEFRDDAVAHVTIARVKERQRSLPLVEFAPVSLEIRNLVLFESLPDPANKTSRYEIGATVSLSP
jgi:RNA 2',3'-cyclic 3'-phosphodiesterase